MTPSDKAPAYVDLGSEMAILGQSLLFPEVWDWARGDGLSDEDFFRTWHRACWRAIVSVGSQGFVPSYANVKAEWHARDENEYPGDTVWGELTTGVPCPTRASVSSSVRWLKQLTLQRRAFVLTEELGVRLRGQTGSLTDGTLDASLRELDALRSQLTEGISFDPMRMIDEMAQSRAIQRQAVLTFGLTPEMDDALGAIAPGEVVGVMARPGVGKTLLLCHLVEELATKQIGQVVYSAEMQASEIARRLAQRLYRLRRWQIEAQLDEGRFDAVKFVETFQTMRLDHTGGITVTEMRRRTDALMRQQHPVRVVLIDHLGRLGAEDARASTYDRVSEQARLVKDMAKALKVAVVLLIQVSREAGGVDGSRKLTLGSARESGVIEENVDYLIGMRRCDRATWATADQRESWRDVLFLSILKNRHNAVPDVEYAIRMDEYLRFAPAFVTAPDEPRERLIRR